MFGYPENQPSGFVQIVSALTLMYQRGRKMAKNPIVIYPSEKEFDLQEYMVLKMKLKIVEELFGE